MKRFSTLIAVFALLTGIQHVYGQELQTSFDAGGKIPTITSEIESKVHLFPNINGFKEARLFELPDSTYVLEIASEQNGKSLQTRKPLTSAQLQSLDTELETELRLTDPSLLQDQSGRADFLLGMAELSIVAYGPSFAILCQSNDASSAVGLSLVASGAGYLIPSALTKDGSVTPAQAKLAISAGWQGYLDGMVIGDLSNTTSASGLCGIAMVSSLAELSVAYSLAGQNNMTEGTASLIANGGVSGMLDGYAIGALLDNSSGMSSGKDGAIILGHFAGYLAGNALANTAKYTPGDATGINLLASLGYFAALVNVNALNTNTPFLSDQSAFTAALIGNIAGYYIGSNLLRNYSLTNSQGTYLDIGTVGGALVGFGFGILADPGGKSPFATSLLATAGAIGGFAGVLASMDRVPLESGNTGLKVTVNPAGLLGALSNTSKENSSLVNLEYAW